MILTARGVVSSLLGLSLLGTACKTSQTKGGAPSEPQKTTPPQSKAPLTENKGTPCSNSENRHIYEERSKYGRFNWSQKKGGENCDITFNSSIGNQDNTNLFEVDCFPGEEISVSAMGCAGNIQLPYIASNGDEFHVFTEETCGSGGCTISYWAAVINDEKMWSTKESFGSDFVSHFGNGSGGIEDVEIKHNSGKPILSLKIPPTSTSEGTIYDVSMGRLETSVIKAKGRSIVSEKQMTLIGTYNSGIGPSEYKDFIEEGDGSDDSGEWHLLDNTENCPQLEKLYDTKVKMVAALTTWSDGATELACVSVRALP